jgi:hypothetical protein
VSQFEQVLEPKLLEYFPASQEMQKELPVKLYLPLEHDKQFTAKLVEYFPASQETQVVAPVLLLVCDPAVQSRHESVNA